MRHEGATYPIVNGCPVLIDFERSIVTREAALGSGLGSPVRRLKASRIVDLARRLVQGSNTRARRFAKRITGALEDQAGDASLLVVGGATIGSGAESLYDNHAVRVIAFDLYRSSFTSFVADAHHIPLADGSVDGVWAQAVLEHVLDPAQVVREIWRVLKPYGIVYAETPFLQQVHEGAFDFTRFTHSGHRWLFRDFIELESGYGGGPGTQLAWTIDYVARSVFRSRLAGRLIKIAFFWVRFLDAVADSRFVFDTASGFYFYGRKSVVPLSAREMPGYYRGAS